MISERNHYKNVLHFRIKLIKAKEIQQTELKQNEVVSKIDSQEISIGDPNDIHLIINKQPEIIVASQPEVNFSKYISPLVHNKRWYLKSMYMSLY